MLPDLLVPLSDHFQSYESLQQSHRLRWQQLLYALQLHILLK